MEVDNKFTVSMADSTMMCILHSAMNKAHAKVQSKHGIVERLNEQSKFYELAIMQLEACLKFVQEETGNYILETTHERLLFDLLEMKDKLEDRLKETELAIAEKDNELIERSANETRLQQILKAKEKELQQYQKSDNSKIYENISELKYRMDQHVWNIKQHLEGERIPKTARLGLDSSPFKIVENIELDKDIKSQTGAYRENDYVKEIDNNFECTCEFLTSFGHMGIEIDSLKKTLDTTFEMISRYDDNPLEQQWLRMIEKDILTIFLKEFVEIVNNELQVKNNIGNNHLVSARPLYVQTWSNFIHDVTLLRDVLEKVKFSYEERKKDIKIHDSHKEIIIHDDKLWQHVHEDSEKEKSDTEKTKPCFLYEYETIIKYIPKNILRKMDEIITWVISLDSSFSNNCVNHEKSKCSTRDKKNAKDPNHKDLIARYHYEVEQHMKKLNLQYLVANNSKYLTHDYDIRLDEYVVQNLIKEDVHTKFLKESIEEMRHNKEKNSIELSNHLEEWKSGVLRNENSHLKLTCIEVIGDHSDKIYDGLKIDKDVPSMEFNSTLEKALRQLDEFKEKLREIRSDDIIKREQIDFEKVEEEVKYALPCFRLAHVDSSCNPRFYTKDNKSSPHTVLNENNEDFLCAQVFYDVVDNFRIMLQEKLAQSYLRLEKLNDHVKILTHEIMYIKREQITYKTAFIQRCQNLQKAEIEVDILGDTVESFTTLLQRIYSTLNHYSIVLQNFPEVTYVYERLCTF
ncbi:WPP domain-associated protein [Chenopodium quinoa]|uniref:WPP domain-associated protein n=1 Tax=Chenopodium quinoa TaxID=63459 RepID=UPI000B76FC06|nr:WPP domain-associated protein [Chenopodium quinoa]